MTGKGSRTEQFEELNCDTFAVKSSGDVCGDRSDFIILAVPCGWMACLCVCVCEKCSFLTCRIFLLISVTKRTFLTILQE